MTTTGKSYTNFFSRRLLTTTSMKDYMLEYLENGQIRQLKMLTTGQTTADDSGAFFMATTPTDGTAGSTLTFSSLYGTDGTGKIIDLADGETTLQVPYFRNVPFEDTASQLYYLGVKSEEIPAGIAHDSTTGILNYDRYQKTLGMATTMTSVSWSSSNQELTLTFRPQNCGTGTDYTGRTAIAWKNNPASSDEAVAIVVGTINQVSSYHSMTISGNFGQGTSPITTASHYTVLILGPMITTVDISPDSVNGAGYAFIGTVIGGTAPRTFDTSEQVEIEPLAASQNTVKEVTSNGWLTKPSVTKGSSSLTFGAGSAYINGTVQSANAGSISDSALSDGNYIIYWSQTDGYVALSATSSNFNTAQQGNRVLVGGFTKDSSFTPTMKQYYIAMKSIKDFDRSVRMVLSSNTAENGAFSDIEVCLGAAQAISTRTDRDVSITIVVRGMIPVDSASLSARPNLHLIPHIKWVGDGNVSGYSYKIQRTDGTNGQSFYGYNGYNGITSPNASGFLFNMSSVKGGFHFDHTIHGTTGLNLPTFDSKNIAQPWQGWIFENINFEATTTSDSNSNPKSFLYADVVGSSSNDLYIYIDTRFKSCSFIGSSHDPSSIARTMGRVAYVVEVESSAGAVTFANTENLESATSQKLLALGQSYLQFIDCDGVMDYGLIRFDRRAPNISQATGGAIKIHAHRCRLIVTGQQRDANLSYTTSPSRKMAVIDIESDFGMVNSSVSDNEVICIPSNHVSGTASLERDPEGTGFIYARGHNRNCVISNNKLTFQRGQNGIPIIGIGVGTNNFGGRGQGIKVVNNIINCLAPSSNSAAEDSASNVANYGAVTIYCRDRSTSSTLESYGAGNLISGNTINLAPYWGVVPQGSSYIDYCGIHVEGSASDQIGVHVSNNDILANTGIRLKTVNQKVMNVQINNNNIAAIGYGIAQITSGSSAPTGTTAGVVVSHNNITHGDATTLSTPVTGIRLLCSSAMITNNVVAHKMNATNTSSSSGQIGIYSSGSRCIIQGNIVTNSDTDLSPNASIFYGSESIVSANFCDKVVKRIETTDQLEKCVIVNNVWERQRSGDDFNRINDSVYSGNVISTGTSTNRSIEYGQDIYNFQFFGNICKGNLTQVGGTYDASKPIVSSSFSNNLFQAPRGSDNATGFVANFTNISGNVLAINQGSIHSNHGDAYMLVTGTHNSLTSNITGYLSSWLADPLLFSINHRIQQADPDVIEFSTVTGNICWSGMGDEVSAVTNKHRFLYSQLTTFTGNYARSTAIHMPRNEASGTGTSYDNEMGITFNSNVVFNKSQFVITKSSISNNLLSTSQNNQLSVNSTQTWTFVQSQLSFERANYGSSGGIVTSDFLNFSSNVVGTALYVDNGKYSITGNTVLAVTTATLNSSSTATASIIADSNATDTIILSNVAESSVYLDGAVTATAFSGLGSYTTQSGGVLNIQY